MVFIRRGFMPGLNTVTWNASDKANMTLSGGNLTTTSGANGSGSSGVRATHARVAGLRYFEILFVTDAQNILRAGLANASWTLASNVGQDSNSVGWNRPGDVVVNGSTIGTVESIAAGDRLCFSVNLGSRRLWCRKNGGNWNNSGTANPVTSTGGLDISAVTGALYPAVSCNNSGAGGAQWTANFGASAFGQAQVGEAWNVET